MLRMLLFDSDGTLLEEVIIVPDPTSNQETPEQLAAAVRRHVERHFEVVEDA